jgi:hypothetical protein
MMKNKSTATDFRSELEAIAEIESSENDLMWSSRVIDEHSRKQSRTVIVAQLSLQDDSAKG